jgi:tetratricopeptide (TPR) repeat protein
METTMRDTKRLCCAALILVISTASTGLARAEALKAVTPSIVRLNNDAEFEAAFKKLEANAPSADASQDVRLNWERAWVFTQNRLRHYDKAEAGTRQLLKLYPYWDFQHINLAIYLGKQGKYKEAEGEAIRAIELSPEDALYKKSVLASWQWYQGKKDEAFENIKAASEVSVDDPQFRIITGCLACFYGSVGDEEKIAYYMERAIKATPNDTAFFRRDICFDPYRAKPWFIKLVGKTLAD